MKIRNIAFLVAAVAFCFSLVSFLAEFSTSSSNFESVAELYYERQLGDANSAELNSDAGEDNEGEEGAPIVRKYSLENALKARSIYRGDFILIIYDPETDDFIPYYSNKMNRNHMTKTMWAYSHMIDSGMLRRTFPERFKPDQPEFAVAVGGMDCPNVFVNACLMEQGENCYGDDIGPILQFGSIFKGPMIPSMIAMPMPVQLHLECFIKYSEGGTEGCPQYDATRSVPGGLVYGESVGSGWDDLIPQVVWRGTDFTYLTNIMSRMEDGQKIGNPYRQPDFETDIAPRVNTRHDPETTKEAATQALQSIYNELLPRWKGVAWTATSEVEAERNITTHHSASSGTSSSGGGAPLPWANIKFSRGRSNGKEIDFDQFEEVGIPALGEYMSLFTLARYKYHFDIGGGGGTTWTGTVQKLALPGLLFHHETPTKDYFADWMIPWQHYVPIREDLIDLKDKFEWAEKHPVEAKNIADNGTKLVKALGTREGFEPFFNRFFRDPLKRVIDAYEPLNHGTTWRDVLSREEYSDMTPTSKQRLLKNGKLH